MSSKDDNTVLSEFMGNMDYAVIQNLPDHIFCKSCGAELIAVEKNTRERRVKIDVKFKTPPKILGIETHKGEAICDNCGEKNPIDLRLFKFL